MLIKEIDISRLITYLDQNEEEKIKERNVREFKRAWIDGVSSFTNTIVPRRTREGAHIPLFRVVLRRIKGRA